jgi:hypothetical protein
MNTGSNIINTPINTLARIHVSTPTTDITVTSRAASGPL